MKQGLIFLIALILISCGKKTQVKGVVYSSHGIPVPSVYVGYHEYHESSYPEDSNYKASKTNEKGEYQFSFRGRKKFLFQVFCTCDSGEVYRTINVGEVNTIDLNLK